MGFAPNPHWRRCPKAPGRTRRLASASVWGFVQKSVRLLLQVLFFRHSPKGLWVKGGYPCAGYIFRRRRRGRAVPQWSAGVKPLKKPFLIPNPHWRRCPKAPAELAVWRLQACGALCEKAFVFCYKCCFFAIAPQAYGSRADTLAQGTPSGEGAGDAQSPRKNSKKLSLTAKINPHPL